MPGTGVSEIAGRVFAPKTEADYKKGVTRWTILKMGDF
jgi:hypothetical protein